MKDIRNQIKFVLTFLLTVILFGASHICNSQGQDLIISPDTGLITYEIVINADSVSADKLFDKAKVWAVETFKSPKIRDVKPSLISTVFNIPVNIGLGVTNAFYHDVKIKVKDGAVKLVIDNIYNDVGHDPAERLFIKDGVITGKSQKKWLKQINDNCVSLGKSLQSAIEKKDDW